MGSATTKRDIVNRIAAETNTPRPVVRQIVQQFLDDVVDELARGHRIEFREFGVFETVTRKPRVARNPRTGVAIEVPARTVAHFRQGCAMRERVAALSSEGPAPKAPPAEAEAEGPPVEERPEPATGEPPPPPSLP